MVMNRIGLVLVLLVGCGPAFTLAETEENPSEVIWGECGEFVPPPPNTVVVDPPREIPERDGGIVQIDAGVR